LSLDLRIVSLASYHTGFRCSIHARNWDEAKRIDGSFVDTEPVQARRRASRGWLARAVLKPDRKLHRSQSGLSLTQS
jgi:hypothetical protein